MILLQYKIHLFWDKFNNKLSDQNVFYFRLAFNKLTVSERSLRSELSWIRLSLERRSVFCCIVWCRVLRSVAMMPLLPPPPPSASSALFSLSRSVFSVYRIVFRLEWTAQQTDVFVMAFNNFTALWPLCADSVDNWRNNRVVSNWPQENSCNIPGFHGRK